MTLSPINSQMISHINSYCRFHISTLNYYVQYIDITVAMRLKPDLVI